MDTPVLPAVRSSEPVWALHSDGTVFDLSSASVASVCFVEIGQCLAGLRRFNGRGLSVAQHSVMGAQAILNEGGTPMEAALYLLHDAHEWAIGDIIRPAEKAIAAHMADHHGTSAAASFLQALSALRYRWDLAIYSAARLPAPDMWSTRQKRVVRSMDDRMCREEAIHRFGPNACLQFDHSTRPKTTGTLKLWGEAKAEERFAELAHRLIGSEEIARQSALAARAREARKA